MLRAWLNANRSNGIEAYKDFAPVVRRFHDARKVYHTLKTLRTRVERGLDIKRAAPKQEEAMPRLARAAYFAMLNASSMYALLELKTR